MQAIQYTIRSIPPQLDQAIRKKARLSGKSLNRVVLDDMKRIYGLGAAKKSSFDDVKDLFGAGMDDETFAILQEIERQDKDPAMLKREQDKLDETFKDTL